MTIITRCIATLVLTVFCAVAGSAQSTEVRATQNIIMVMTDGLRWQEVFRGAEASLITKQNKVKDAAALKKAYWRDTPEARREALMPFLWRTIAKQGQIYGNRDKGSVAHVTNKFFFSYPGYSETLCGFADPGVNSNDKVPNPNISVLEWLNKKASYQGKVAAFAAWDVFPSILNAPRAGFPVIAGYDPLTTLPDNPRVDLLNHLKVETPRYWDEEPFDNLPFYTAVEYLKERKPRVLYISMGETDDWAHDHNYANYLDAAHRVDEYLRVLWEMVQSMPEYRGKTTLIFSPDHGRGSGPKWTEHGSEEPPSKFIWMAFMGPDTQALGERSHVPVVTQNQIAATLATFLGEDYNTEVPKAGKPIADVLKH
ncbi:MAG: alkaline phosphatase family protein [Acidobacteria bacterium]|nr:alkaline phosphatase family protein [Acidobacteriota bacterium]